MTEIELKIEQLRAALAELDAQISAADAEATAAIAAVSLDDFNKAYGRLEALRNERDAIAIKLSNCLKATY